VWSDVDIMEMVHTFKNSPSVVMWSIGNEIRGRTVASRSLIASNRAPADWYPLFPNPVVARAENLDQTGTRPEDDLRPT